MKSEMYDSINDALCDARDANRNVALAVDIATTCTKIANYSNELSHADLLDDNNDDLIKKALQVYGWIPYYGTRIPRSMTLKDKQVRLEAYSREMHTELDIVMEFHRRYYGKIQIKLWLKRNR